MVFSVRGRRVRIDVGHVAFVLAIGGYCVWYLFDARKASTNIQNLVLIQPAVVAAVILCLLVLRQTVTVETSDASDDRPPWTFGSLLRSDEARVFAFMVLLIAYVLSIEVIGFDVASLLFVVLSLLLQGERRPLVLTLLPLLFTAGMVYAFVTLLGVSVPTAFAWA